MTMEISCSSTKSSRKWLQRWPLAATTRCLGSRLRQVWRFHRFARSFYSAFLKHLAVVWKWKHLAVWEGQLFPRRLRGPWSGGELFGNPLVELLLGMPPGLFELGADFCSGNASLKGAVGPVERNILPPLRTRRFRGSDLVVTLRDLRPSYLHCWRAVVCLWCTWTSS